LLDSALSRPVNKHAYEGCTDIAVLAAAYGFAPARNPAFVDGNKRVAFLAVGVFLAINAHGLSATPLEAIDAMLALASGDMDEAAFAKWIRDHLREVQ
jgi:death-on-curing protein